MRSVVCIGFSAIESDGMVVEGLWWMTFGRTRAVVRVEPVRRRAAVVIFISKCRW